MALGDDEKENAAYWAGVPRPWPRAVVGRARPGATALASWLDPADATKSASQRETRNVALARPPA